jgi:hypothetical protein
MPKKKTTSPVDQTKEKKAIVFRTIEEREAELDKKIKYHEDMISVLNAKKEKLRAPRKARVSFQTVINELKASGKTPAEILELLKK